MSAAHEVPFAHEPDREVRERFIVEIVTPETGTYCGCETCKHERIDFYRCILKHKLQAFLDVHDVYQQGPLTHAVSAFPLEEKP